MVSMKSGLEGRNNQTSILRSSKRWGLNEVRPRRPEQSEKTSPTRLMFVSVSMKSGLEGRNNFRVLVEHGWKHGLNEVRPRRPEQISGNQRSIDDFKRSQ